MVGFDIAGHDSLSGRSTAPSNERFEATAVRVGEAHDVVGKRPGGAGWESADQLLQLRAPAFLRFAAELDRGVGGMEEQRRAQASVGVSPGSGKEFSAD
jgi:hypothetical protein